MTLTDQVFRTEESPWEESKDIALEAFCHVGEDLVLTVNLCSVINDKDYKFEVCRGEPPIPSDRFRVETHGNMVQLMLHHASTGDAGHYALVAKKLPYDNESERFFSRRVYISVDMPFFTDKGEHPFFLRRLTDLTVKVGTRTRFLVEICSATDPKVVWHRNDKSIQVGPRLSFAHEGNFYCVDIEPVTVEDQGHWTCMAENHSGRSSCTSHLNVLVPKAYKRPEFVSNLRVLLTEIGNVSLECKVVGVPTPVLKWFKDEKEIKAGDVFALTVNPDDPTSLGTYTCEAVNCMGTAYSSSRVHVKGSEEGFLKPDDTFIVTADLPVFKKMLKNDSCKIGESILLSCQVQVPPWPKEITWYNKQGYVDINDRYKTIEDGLGSYSIRVNPVEAVDEGEWKCVATSENNVKQFTTCYVTMSIPKNYRQPRFMESLKAVLTEEGLVSFECKVVGFPTPLLRWFKDGQELKPGDVYQLTGTNSLGSYYCIARNCMGEAKSTAELTIEDIKNQLNEEERLQLLTTSQPPKFLKGLRSSEVKINENFKFSVQVSSILEPSLTWYRDNHSVENEERYQVEKESLGICHLEIYTLEFCDQAEWKCVASNDFGHTITSCFLKLIIPKHYKKPKFLENLRAILSDSGVVNLECKVIGVPQPILKWYKDGEELKPGDIHRIISGQDGTCCLGTYTCEAINCMGAVSSSASVLGFEDRILRGKEFNVTTSLNQIEHKHELLRNFSLSTIQEERTSQLLDIVHTDHSVTLDDRGEVSFSFDGKEVSVSLYETPDLTEEEALKIVEMYADQLSQHITEQNVIELPPMRFTKETSTSGNLLMEAVVIDVSPDYFVSVEEADDLRTEADFEDMSMIDTFFSSPPLSESVGEPNMPIRPPRRKSVNFFSKMQEQQESESYHSAKEPLIIVNQNKDDFDIEMDIESETFTDAVSSAQAKVESIAVDIKNKNEFRKRTIQESFNLQADDISIDSVYGLNKKNENKENTSNKKQRLEEKDNFQESSIAIVNEKSLKTYKADLGTYNEEEQLSLKIHKYKLVDLLRQIYKPLLIIREALIDSDDYVKDIFLFNGFMNDNIVIPIQNLCELISDIETTTLKYADERSLIQNIRISILENIREPIEELLKGFELIRLQENQNNIQINLSILESLVDPVDEIIFSLAKLEYDLSGQNISKIPVVLERTKRIANRLEFTVQELNTEKKIPMTTVLQKVHQILSSYLNSIIFNQFGRWIENIDAVLIESLLRPLEDLDRSSKYIIQGISQNIPEAMMKMSDAFNEILSRLDALVVALDGYKIDYRTNFVINLKTSLVAAAEELSITEKQKSDHFDYDRVQFSLSEMILDALINLQIMFSNNTLHVIEQSIHESETTNMCKYQIVVNLLKLSEAISYAIRKTTTLKEDETIQAIINLKASLIDLYLSFSDDYIKEISMIKNIFFPLESLKKIIYTVIQYIQNSESKGEFLDIIQSTYSLIQELKKKISLIIQHSDKKKSDTKLGTTKNVNLEMCILQKITNNLKIALELSILFFHLTTILEKYGDVLEMIQSPIFLKINEIKQNIKNAAIEINKSSINTKPNTIQFIKNLSNLKQLLLKLQYAFINTYIKLEGKDMLKELLEPLNSIQIILINFFQTVVQAEDIMVVVNLIDDIKTDIIFCINMYSNRDFHEVINIKSKIDMNVEIKNKDLQKNHKTKILQDLLTNENVLRNNVDSVSITELFNSDIGIQLHQISKISVSKEVNQNVIQSGLSNKSFVTKVSETSSETVNQVPKRLNKIKEKYVLKPLEIIKERIHEISLDTFKEDKFESDVINTLSERINIFKDSLNNLFYQDNMENHDNMIKDTVSVLQCLVEPLVELQNSLSVVRLNRKLLVVEADLLHERINVILHSVKEVRFGIHKIRNEIDSTEEKNQLKKNIFLLINRLDLDMIVAQNKISKANYAQPQSCLGTLYNKSILSLQQLGKIIKMIEKNMDQRSLIYILEPLQTVFKQVQFAEIQFLESVDQPLDEEIIIKGFLYPVNRLISSLESTKWIENFAIHVDDVNLLQELEECISNFGSVLLTLQNKLIQEGADEQASIIETLMTVLIPFDYIKDAIHEISQTIQKISIDNSKKDIFINEDCRVKEIKENRKKIDISSDILTVLTTVDTFVDEYIEVSKRETESLTTLKFATIETIEEAKNELIDLTDELKTRMTILIENDNVQNISIRSNGHIFIKETLIEKDVIKSKSLECINEKEKEPEMTQSNINKNISLENAVNKIRILNHLESKSLEYEILHELKFGEILTGNFFNDAKNSEITSEKKTANISDVPFKTYIRVEEIERDKDTEKIKDLDLIINQRDKVTLSSNLEAKQADPGPISAKLVENCIGPKINIEQIILSNNFDDIQDSKHVQINIRTDKLENVPSIKNVDLENNICHKELKIATKQEIVKEVDSQLEFTFEVKNDFKNIFLDTQRKNLQSNLLQKSTDDIETIITGKNIENLKDLNVSVHEKNDMLVTNNGKNQALIENTTIFNTTTLSDLEIKIQPAISTIKKNIRKLDNEMDNCYNLKEIGLKTDIIIENFLIQKNKEIIILEKVNELRNINTLKELSNAIKVASKTEVEFKDFEKIYERELKIYTHSKFNKEKLIHTEPLMGNNLIDLYFEEYKNKESLKHTEDYSTKEPQELLLKSAVVCDEETTEFQSSKELNKLQKQENLIYQSINQKSIFGNIRMMDGKLEQMENSTNLNNGATKKIIKLKNNDIEEEEEKEIIFQKNIERSKEKEKMQLLENISKAQNLVVKKVNSNKAENLNIINQLENEEQRNKFENKIVQKSHEEKIFQKKFVEVEHEEDKENVCRKQKKKNTLINEDMNIKINKKLQEQNHVNKIELLNPSKIAQKLHNYNNKDNQKNVDDKKKEQTEEQNKNRGEVTVQNTIKIEEIKYKDLSEYTTIYHMEEIKTLFVSIKDHLKNLQKLVIETIRELENIVTKDNGIMECLLDLEVSINNAQSISTDLENMTVNHCKNTNKLEFKQFALSIEEVTRYLGILVKASINIENNRLDSSQIFDSISISNVLSSIIKSLQKLRECWNLIIKQQIFSEYSFEYHNSKDMEDINSENYKDLINVQYDNNIIKYKLKQYENVNYRDEKQEIDENEVKEKIKPINEVQKFVIDDSQEKIVEIFNNKNDQIEERENKDKFILQKKEQVDNTNDEEIKPNEKIEHKLTKLGKNYTKKNELYNQKQKLELKNDMKYKDDELKQFDEYKNINMHEIEECIKIEVHEIVEKENNLAFQKYLKKLKNQIELDKSQKNNVILEREVVDKKQNIDINSPNEQLLEVILENKKLNKEYYKNITEDVDENNIKLKSIKNFITEEEKYTEQKEKFYIENLEKKKQIAQSLYIEDQKLNNQEGCNKLNKEELTNKSQDKELTTKNQFIVEDQIFRIENKEYGNQIKIQDMKYVEKQEIVKMKSEKEQHKKIEKKEISAEKEDVKQKGIDKRKSEKEKYKRLEEGKARVQKTELEKQNNDKKELEKKERKEQEDDKFRNEMEDNEKQDIEKRKLQEVQYKNLDEEKEREEKDKRDKQEVREKNIFEKKYNKQKLEKIGLKKEKRENQLIKVRKMENERKNQEPANAEIDTKELFTLEAGQIILKQPNCQINEVENSRIEGIKFKCVNDATKVEIIMNMKEEKQNNLRPIISEHRMVMEKDSTKKFQKDKNSHKNLLYFGHYAVTSNRLLRKDDFQLLPKTKKDLSMYEFNIRTSSSLFSSSNFLSLTLAERNIEKKNTVNYKYPSSLLNFGIESKHWACTKLFENIKKDFQHSLNTPISFQTNDYSMLLTDSLALNQYRRNPTIAYQRNLGLTSFSRNKLLEQGKSPLFCTKLTNCTVAEGSHVRLICIAVGQPKPQIYWTKNENRVRSGKREWVKYKNGMEILEISNTVLDDSGYYACLAENPYGKLSSEATVRVYPIYKTSPVKSSLTSIIDDKYKLMEKELRIRRQTLPLSSCIKDERTLPGDRYRSLFGYENKNMLIKKENNTFNSQLYGTEKERDKLPQISVSLNDYKAPLGGTIALQVEVKDSLKSNVTWLRDRRERKELILSPKVRSFVESDVHSLIVSKETEFETGAYVCQVSNGYGHVDTSTTIEVIPSSKFHKLEKPAAFVSRPSQRIIHSMDGEAVSISFRICGIPRPRVFWMKGLKNILDRPRSHKEMINDYVRLTLIRVNLEDEGTYCILVKNCYGFDRFFFTLKVRQKARSLTPSVERLSASDRLSDIHIREQQSYLRNVPGAISSEPVVVDGGRNWLSLTWGKADQRGPAPVVAYRVDAWQIGEDGGARWIELGISPINSFDAFNLRPGREYKFRVTPKNRYGWGESVTMNDSAILRNDVEIPEFTKNLSGQIKALEGSSIELKCEVRSYSKFDIKWYREITEIKPDSKYIITNDRFKCSLILKNINEHDSGRYICKVTNKAGKVSSYGRILVVNDPKILNADVRLKKKFLDGLMEDGSPQFTMRLRDRRVQISYPVRLTCQVLGCPEPEIMWFKDGNVVTESSTRLIYSDEFHFHTLEIARATLEDSGSYIVCAKNANGSVSCRCILVVDKGIRAYVAPQFIYDLDVAYAVKVGSNLKLRTQIEAYPSVGITWYRDGIRLRPRRTAVMTLSHDGIAELILAKVRHRDAGVYTCTAINEVGKAETFTKLSIIDTENSIKGADYNTSPHVIINSPDNDITYSKVPLFVMKPLSTEAQEGDTVIIQCKVVGDPKPEVIWLRDFLKPNYYRGAAQFQCVGAGPQYCLEIPHAKLDYSGTYSVLAKNEYGEAKAIISLQIYAKGQRRRDNMDKICIKQREILSVPTIKTELKDIRCCDGDAVTFEFKIFALSEPPLVRWEKSGKSLPLDSDFSTEFDGESAKIIIHHVYPEDEGEYSCIVTNELGKAFTSACLVVDVPEGKENIISQSLLMKPQTLFSTGSTPKSTLRSTPVRSLSPGISRGHELKAMNLPQRINSGISFRHKPKIYPPKFYSIPHNRVAEEGETVRFQCIVAGYPKPWNTWDKDGVNVSSNSRISLKEKDDIRILEITDVTLEDAGLYRVTLESDIGRTEATARLEIINRNILIPRPIRTRSASPRTYPTFSRSLLSAPTRLNGRFQLQCAVRSPSTTWYSNIADHGKRDIHIIVDANDDYLFRNETKLERSFRIKKSFVSQRAILEISDVMYSDAGEYICEAKNLFGSTRSICKVIVLDVDDPSKNDCEPPKFLVSIPCKSIMVENHSYELQARLSDTPPFNILWFKDGHEIVNNSHYQHVVYEDSDIALRFFNVHPLVAGEYMSTVQNELGETSCRGLFIVQDYKSGSSSTMLSFVKIPVSVFVEKGETVCFYARIKSDQSIDIDWKINSKSMQDDTKYKIERNGSTSILRILLVTQRDCGDLRCIASIIRGPSISSSVQLHLKPYSLTKLRKNNWKHLESRSHSLSRLRNGFVQQSNGISTLNLLMNKSNVDPKKQDSCFTCFTSKQQGFSTESVCKKCGKKWVNSLKIVKKTLKTEKFSLKKASFEKKRTKESVTKKLVSISIENVTINIKDIKHVHPNIKFTHIRNEIDKYIAEILATENILTSIELNVFQERNDKINDGKFSNLIPYNPKEITKERLSIKRISSFKNSRYNSTSNIIDYNVKTNVNCNNNNSNKEQVVSIDPSKKFLPLIRMKKCDVQHNRMKSLLKPCKRIFVNRKEVPALVLRSPSDIITLRGSTIVLEVIYQGHPDPSIKWMRAGRELVSKERTQIDSTAGLSRLTLIGITADQAGKYAVAVENALGNDCRFISVAVEGPPESLCDSPKVTSLRLESGEYGANVTWCSPAYDGGCALSGYTLEYRRIGELCWRIVTENCHSLRHEVTGLHAGATYLFRVRAINVHGSSEPSPVSWPFKVPFLDMDYVEDKLKVEEKETDINDDKIVTAQEGYLFNVLYEVNEELGKGRYGLVKRVVEKKSAKSFAAKFVRIFKSSDRQQVGDEMKIMNLLRHPKLLRLTAAFESPREIVMVTEYISGGELFERVVADDFTLTEKDSILFMRQICDGVKYMHENNVVHLDLKPENIMCHTQTSHRIKLIDFGLAQVLSPNKPIRVLFGTPEFIPPEIINYEPIGMESDMWSVGVICYVLLTGLSPFMGDNDAETFANIVRADYDFEDEAFNAISPDAKDFISNLLQKKKELRMSAKQCLSHSWLAQHTENMSRIALPTDKLKKFIVRRKWQKTGNALRALGRMAMLSANRRNSSISPTSTQSLSEVARLESLNSDFDYDSTLRKAEDKSFESSISSRQIRKRENEIWSEEQIFDVVLKQDSAIEKGVTISNKELTSKETDKDIDEVFDQESVNSNLDIFSVLKNKNKNNFIEEEISYKSNEVPFNILNKNNSTSNKNIDYKEKNMNRKKSINEEMDKIIFVEKQLGNNQKEIVHVENTGKKNEYDGCIKYKADEVSIVDQNDYKLKNTKIKSITCSKFDKIYNEKDNHSNKLSISKNIQTRIFLPEISKLDYRGSIKSDKTDIKRFNHKDIIIPTNLKVNKDIIFDRDVTRHSFCKFNTHFEANSKKDSRLKVSSKQGRLFIPTGNVSRTAKLFENMETEQCTGILGNINNRNGIATMVKRTLVNSTILNDKPRNERIQRAFAFWNK